MSFRKMALLTALSLSMASAPVMAQSSPTGARSGVSMEDASDQGRGRGRDRRDDDDRDRTTTYIIAFFVIIVIGLGIYIALDNDQGGRVSP